MTSEQPDFGPPGYLPERASKRARKIVLRSPLGWQWMAGAIALGVVLIVLAIVFVRTATRPPGAPFVAVGSIASVGDARYLAEHEVLVVAAVGRVRSFDVDPSDVPVYCAAANQLETPGGRVFNPTGRALDGGASLDEHPTVVVDAVVYLDPTRTVAGLAPQDTGARPACVS